MLAIQIPLISLALFVGALIFATIFVRGLATGKASTKYHPVVERATNPAGFWAAEVFNAIFAIACLYGSVVAIIGL